MAHNPTGDDSRTASEKLRDLPIGRFVTLKKIEQGGALQARRLSTGTVQFYWRYTHNGKTDRVGLLPRVRPPETPGLDGHRVSDLRQHHDLSVQFLKDLNLRRKPKRSTFAIAVKIPGGDKRALLHLTSANCIGATNRAAKSLSGH